ncbi:MAG: TRAM domain-containing protein, partial [Gemmatimonadaceae bacterium]
MVITVVVLFPCVPALPLSTPPAVGVVEREQSGRCTGRTRGGQLVHCDGHRGLIGRLVEVEVTEATP